MVTRQKNGKYFSVSLTEVEAITHLHVLNPSISPADSDTIAVYLILCRGAGKFDTTAWKSYGICKRTNLTLTRTESAISWLIDNGFVEKIAYNSKECGPEMDIECQGEISSLTPDRAFGIKNGGKYHYQISRHHTGRCVSLPNLLVDGQVGHHSDPALKRLLKDSKADFRLGIDIHAARLDAILLLLQLYGEHSIDSYGGINPSVWQGTWTYSTRKEEFENSPFESSISDQPFGFFSAQEQKEIFNSSILKDMFSYIEDEALRARRLEHALKQLRASRFAYKVIQVWGRLRESNKGYDIMYPLHIIDSSQRNQNEPEVGSKILEHVIEYADEFEGIKEEYDRITRAGEQDVKDSNSLLNLNGVFFLAAKGASMLTLTTLRLRYRAHDADTAIGIAEQQRMVEDWEKTLEALLNYA
jgi:hypothetical protein